MVVAFLIETRFAAVMKLLIMTRKYPIGSKARSPRPARKLPQTMIKTVTRMRREAVFPRTTHSRSITDRTERRRKAENMGILTSLRARRPTVTLAIKNVAGKIRMASWRG